MKTGHSRAPLQMHVHVIWEAVTTVEYIGGNSSCTVKKTGPRGVRRFEGCYSPGSVMATHKGVQLTSMGVGRLCWGVSSIPHQEWGVR